MSEVFEGIWFPIADNIISTDSKNDHPANFQVAIDAHCKRLPIAPDHPTTNVQPANPPPNHLACQFADPQEIFKARNFCVAPHVQPNCKMRSIRSRGRKSSLNMTDTRRRRKTLPCERRRTFGAYVEGRFAGDAGSGKWRVASALAGGSWSGRWVAGFGSVTGSTITLAPIFTRPYMSATSSLVSRIQPDETRFPIVSGLLVP